MTDSTRVNDLQNKLLQAMGIVNMAQINSISYDKTILCTIEDDSKKKEGKYEVSDGSVIFTAYSQDTSYYTGNQVYVTIPNGSYDNQKIIIGKKTSEIEKPFVFTQPFDTIFDLTGQITIPKDDKTKHGLIANGIEKEILIGEWNELTLPKYDRLGIRADFQTWCSEAVSGSYGIRLEIETDIPDIITTEKQENKFTLLLDSSDMYGNPYNFESNYSQEKVYDISNIGQIISIKAYFYQLADFKNIKGEDLIVADEFKAFPNLFVDNLYICAGYDLGTFDQEYVNIITEDKLTYSENIPEDDPIHKEELSDEQKYNIYNKKTLTLQWVHLDNQERYDMSKKKATEKPEVSYEVRWYRYRVGAPAADNYCGVYWERVTNNIVNYENIINGQMSFIPDKNNQIEKIKAIVFINNVPYHSEDIIQFDNLEIAPNTTEKYYDNALEIITNDGTNGNYMVYGQSGRLLDYDVKEDDKTTAKNTVTLSLTFNSSGDFMDQKNWNILGEKDYDNVVWTIPVKNTMMNFVLSEDEQKQDTTFITRIGGQPQYTLKTQYSPSYNNNTVTASYLNYSVTYDTEKEFTFGYSGTMGTDQTIVIDFEGDQKYYDINEQDKKVKFIVRIYDAAGRDISENISSDSNITWDWKNEPSNAGIITPITDNNQEVEITTSGWSMDDLPILQVKVGDLETYFPIPLQNGSNYTHITGATQVIYRTDGVPEYDRSEYKLYKDNKEETGISWSIIGGGDGYTAKLSKETYGRLSPIDIYIEDALVYGAKCAYWTQPILVVQNRWSSNVINNWDGQTIETEDGHILSAAIAAGKKDTDGSFSGVMLGDWSNQQTSEAIARNTGIYGFQKGAMVYSLKDTGVMTLGRSGKGQIILDGNSSTLQSATYNNGQGMQINLTAGTINAHQFTLTAGSGDSKIIIDSTAPKTDDEDDRPLMLGNHFSVAWDGTIYAQAGSIGNWNINIDNNGSLESANRKIRLDGTNSQIEINTGYAESRGLVAKNGNTIYGRVGYISGTSTDNIGITSYNGYGIILDSANVARITASNTINLEVPKLNNKGIYLSESNSTNHILYFRYDTNPGEWYMQCNVPAARQHGIYARFA